MRLLMNFPFLAFLYGWANGGVPHKPSPLVSGSYCNMRTVLVSSGGSACFAFVSFRFTVPIRSIEDAHSGLLWSESGVRVEYQ